MSKRPDENEAPDMEAGMTTAERRRRRRRGGGLRVPSDNVPRRSPTTPPPVAAPVPEDPNLAVSIAYSFASDGSGPLPRSDTAELPVQEMRPDTLTGDGPEVGDVIIAPDAQSTAVDVDDLDEGDGQFEAKTREMDAVDLEALGLTDPSEEAKLPKPRAPSTPGPSTSIIIDDDQMTAIQQPPPRPQPTSQPPPLRPQSTSQPPPLKAQAQARPAQVSAPVLKPPPGTEFPPPDAFDEDEKSIEIDVEYVGRPEDGPTLRNAAPVAAERRPVDLRVGRASTVALSDDDLEELRDGGGSGRVKQIAKSGETVQLSDIDLEDVGERAPTPRIDKQLARATKDESGEIVVDVIEEVDSGDIAAPVVAVAPVAPVATSTAPGLGATRPSPSGSMPQLNGGGQAHRPPPTPPGAHTGTTAPPPMSAGAPTVVKVVDHVPPPPPAASKAPPPAPGKKPTVATTAAAVAAAGAAAKTPDGKRAKRGKPWFEEIFDEDYLRTLPFLTPQATQSEAQFVVDVLGVQAGAQLLDLGCGYGRHAMELAARGFHLVGLDLSLPLLLRGADEAQRRGLSINFVHADMRELDFDAQFDGVYCLFSTFGFFDDETNKKTATAVARALKPGGRCVIEVLNRDYVIGELPTRVWWEGDGCVVLEEVEFNYFSSRIHSNRSVVFDDGRQIEQEISVRAYSLHELGKLLHAAGFRVVEVSGSVHTRGRYFGNHSRHIIVVAEKKPKDGHDNGK